MIKKIRSVKAVKPVVAMKAVRITVRPIRMEKSIADLNKGHMLPGKPGHFHYL